MRYGPGHSIDCPANRAYSNAYTPRTRPCTRYFWKLDNAKRKELEENRRLIARIKRGKK